MSNNIDVSIIVPIYNVSKYIEACAVSILEQTYDNIEYIFVNDCTPDNSIDILMHVIERFPNRKERIKIINNRQNRGLAYCRNIGVENASGEYVMHVDGDDYITRTAVESLLCCAHANNADIVISDFYLTYSNKIIEQHFEYPDLNSPQYLEEILKRNLPVCVCGKLIARSLYVKNGISVPENICFGEDMATTPRLIFFAEKIIKIERPFYYYVQMNSTSYCKNIKEDSIKGALATEYLLRTFFSNRVDSDVLNKAMDIYRQKLRGELLFKADNKLRRKYSTLFMSDKYDLSLLPLRERIMAVLIMKEWHKLADIYKAVYSILFNIKKKLLK